MEPAHCQVPCEETINLTYHEVAVSPSLTHHHVEAGNACVPPRTIDLALLVQSPDLPEATHDILSAQIVNGLADIRESARMDMTHMGHAMS